MTTIDDAAELVRGVSYRKQDASSSPATGLVAILRATNISDRIDLNDHLVFVPERYVSERQYLQSGDTIIATSSGSSLMVGKSAPLRSSWVGSFGAFCGVLRPRKGVDPLYLSYFVASAEVRQRWSGLARGTNINNLKVGDIGSTWIPLAPPSEQSRIVAAIEEHFSHLDTGVASLNRARRNLQRMGRAVLISVVPDRIPPHWTRTTVGEAGVVQLGRQRSPKYHHGPNMRPYLRVANVFEDRIDLTDVKEMDFPPENLDRYLLKPGDILLNEGQTPDLVGRPAMYRGEMPGVCFTNSLIRFQPNDDVDGEFALLVFRRHLHSGRFKQEAQITTNMAHMAAGRFKSVEFPIPPVAEQRDIVAEAQRRLSVIAALHREIDLASRRARNLRKALLANAFAGNLVPHDEIDQPAMDLVEGIASGYISRRALSDTRTGQHERI